MINDEEKALRLLRNATRHLRQVIKMVEEHRYCLAIIQKSRVVQKYLKMADEELLSNHLKKCVKRMLKGDDKDRQLQEILVIFKKVH